MLKKLTTSFVLSTLLGLGLLLPATATTANAAVSNAAVDTRCYYSSKYHRYTCYKKANFYRRHRKAINIGAGAVGGAVLGGLIGGRRGAGIGALAGAGGGYLVTKKQHSKHYTRKYYVYSRP
ncbi:MAG TPA: glycine zipper domain-containing protein, partial [Pyrinomonadaceae bacterium]|nr:glycine zipper domain-containing protein [Pyrinomonadaceae bacterium]